MDGGLTIEVDEDVALVENATTASLFSPGMWVQRPTRTPAAAVREMVLPTHHSTASGLSMDVDERRASVMEPMVVDPDLAYLSIADETAANAEKEYMKQDSEHMAALADAYAKLREDNRSMEQQLKGVVSTVNDVMDENRTIKQLLAMLQVRREDFVFNPQQTIAAQQEGIGLRLLRNLEASQPGAQQQQEQQPGQQQQQHAQQVWPAASSQQQQQVQQGWTAACSQQQQGWATTSAQHQHGSAVFEASPGCLLPITPSMRTVSPKIGAFRQDQQPHQQQQQVPPTVVPASPYDFPAEAQIAAAALTAKQGDTAAALLTLLDKAIEGRMDRQQHTQQQQMEEQRAQQQRTQKQQSQQQQQQQQMYPM